MPCAAGRMKVGENFVFFNFVLFVTFGVSEFE